MALIRGTAAAGVEPGMFRDMHTLRGDAGVIGAKDVALLARRLEDLLFAARGCGYRVHDDVDIVVTMAIQFIGILLRKRADAPQPGIDIDGFLKQIEEVLSLQLRRSPSAPPLRSSAAPRFAPAPSTPLSGVVRERLATAATTVFVEHLRATGLSRDRLRGVWRTLSSTVADMEAVALGPFFDQHAAAITSLARDLGKSVRVVRDAGDARAAAEVLDVLATAVLHASRNAIDHGIEPPAERSRAGKAEEGTIRIGVRSEAEQIVVTVDDDGAGVDLDRVRERAVELGVMTRETAFSAESDQLLELLFAPRMSTRDVAGDVSGRGIGLDAVRASIESLGGTVALGTRRGSGTRISIRVPQTRLEIDVLSFTSTEAEVALAVPATWSVEEGSEDDAVDLISLLGLPMSRAPANAVRAVQLRGGTGAERRGNERISTLWMEGVIRPAIATRVCPTGPTQPLEVVLIDDVETVLLRPEVFDAAGLEKARGRRTRTRT